MLTPEEKEHRSVPAPALFSGCQVNITGATTDKIKSLMRMTRQALKAATDDGVGAWTATQAQKQAARDNHHYIAWHGEVNKAGLVLPKHMWSFSDARDEEQLEADVKNRMEDYNTRVGILDKVIGLLEREKHLISTHSQGRARLAWPNRDMQNLASAIAIQKAVRQTMRANVDTLGEYLQWFEPANSGLANDLERSMGPNRGYINGGN